MSAYGITDKWTTCLSEMQLTGTKINGQAESSKKVQPQQSIHPRTRRQGMTEHRKSEALLPEGGQPLQFDARRKLNSASGGNLDPVRCQRRIVSNSHQHRNVHQGAGGSGIDGQA